MKPLVTQKEERSLKKFLSLSPVPEMTLSYYELRGYLYGIAITPDVIEPGEWMPLVCGDQPPIWESGEQARELTSALLIVLNKHIAAFNEQRLSMPFKMETIEDNDFENIVEWTSGLEEALTLRPEFWDEYQGLGDDEHDLLMNSLVVVEGIVYPEDAVDMFDHLPRGELLEIGINLSGNHVERIGQIQYFMLQALELSVETIQDHAFRLESLRRERLRTSDSPFQLRSSSIGKNVACPCGSGRKHGECCARHIRPREGVAGDSLPKKGKLIKVDFSRHDKNREMAASLKTRRTAGKYQLQVSLSFTEPEVWRRIQVPRSFSLAELHELVQLAMGWQDKHLHHFQAGTRFFGARAAREEGDAIYDESQYCLADLERQLLEGIVYTYDFGDNWEHVIILEKSIADDEGAPLPLVIDGARACPPEDIGGVAIYHELLAFLQGDTGKRQLFESSILDEYDPDVFDVEDLNLKLANIYGRR